MTAWYYNNLDKNSKQLFDDLFGSLSVNAVDNSSVQTKENSDAFIVTAALPGAKRDDIKISSQGSAITLTYLPKDANPFARNISRSWGAKGLDVDGLNASYVDGILSIVVPKLKKDPEPKVKTFNIA